MVKILNNRLDFKDGTFFLSQLFLCLGFFWFPISLSAVNLSLLLSLLFWMLAFFGGHTEAKLTEVWHNPITLPALLLVFLIIGGAFWSPANWSDIADFFRKYLKFLVLPILLVLLADPKTRARCWQGFILAMLITLVTTWLNVWFQLPWSRTQNQGFGIDHTVFKDHISQGIMMAFFACLSLFFALKSKSKFQTAIWFGVATLAVVSILFLSSGRTGYLALIFSLLVFAVFAIGVSKKAIFGIFIAGALAIALVFSVSPQFQQRTVQAWEEAKNSNMSSVTSVGARVQIWRFALSKVNDNPVLGAGTASYPVDAAKHFDAPQWCSVVCTHPHNQFIFFLFELGAIGLLIFLWFVVAIARQALHYSPHHKALMLSFVTIIVASNMTNSSFWISTESHFLILMPALFMASAVHRNRLSRA